MYLDLYNTFSIIWHFSPFFQSLFFICCWRPPCGAQARTTQRDRPSLPCPAPASSVWWYPGETRAKSCRQFLQSSPTMAATRARQYRSIASLMKGINSCLSLIAHDKNLRMQQNSLFLMHSFQTAECFCVLFCCSSPHH